MAGTCGFKTSLETHHSGRHGRAGVVDDPAEGETDFAADDDGVRAAVDLPAAEGRVAALGAESRGIDRPARYRGR